MNETDRSEATDPAPNVAGQDVSVSETTIDRPPPSEGESTDDVVGTVKYGASNSS